MSKFLPIRAKEVQERGWDCVDFICVTGDAYVDHPSFGTSVVARVLESMGFRVAILAQPDYKNDHDFKKFGQPKYGFFVSSGCIDSMVNHYTAAKRKRSDDVYTPGNVAGKRPDRAVTVYCNKIKELYPQSAIVIGGVEASLRRFAHYDYWDDIVKPSILVDSKADLLIFGMGEHQTRAIASRLAKGEPIHTMHDVLGTAYLAPLHELPEGEHVSCASYKKVKENKPSYAKACKIQIEEQDFAHGKIVVQKQDDTTILVQNSPMPPLNEAELDAVFALPFTREYHPSYAAQGGIKAIEEVEFSIMHNRGCFGDCNFCAITFHQGKQVTSRSKESILKEAQGYLEKPNFKGYIHDVGGPTANFRTSSCEKAMTKGSCRDRKCLGISSCPALKVDHTEYLDILRDLRRIQGIKKVFVRSGLRYDYILKDKDDTFLKEIIEHHVSGQLKIAPEHCTDQVLQMMSKPRKELFEEFERKFYELTKKAKKEQYIVPYLMSSHPGSTLEDAIELSIFLRKHNLRPEQVQDFYPTPGTVSTCMFYTGLDPMTGKEVSVPRTPQEKRMQRVLLQYFKPENATEVREALIKARRTDLIGTTPNCLVAPDPKFLIKCREEQRAKGNQNPKGRSKTGQHRNQANQSKDKTDYRKFKK